MLNPNKKFISIYNILGKGGFVKDLKKGVKLEENSIIIKEEDIYSISNKEVNKDILVEI